MSNFEDCHLLADTPASDAVETPVEIGRAGSLHAQGMKREALEEITRLLNAKPDCAEAYCIRAIVQMDLEQYAEAVVSWDRFHQFVAPDCSSRLSRAQCSQQLGRWSEAADEFRAILAEDPDFDEATLRLGLSLIRTQQPEEAVTLLSKYLERHPDEPSARFGLAFAHQMLWMPEAAVQHYESLIEEGVYRIEALTNLVGIYRQQKDALRLAQCGLRLLQEAPDSIAGLEAAAQAAYLQEDFSTAVSYCEKTIALDYSRAERWLNLALCRRKLGQPELALQAYEKAASLHSEMTEAHVRIVELMLELEREAEALDACRRGITACPDAEELYQLLSQIHEKEGRKREAEDALEALVARRPESANGWFSLGNLRLDRHDHSGAQAAYWACLSLRDSWSEARLNLALAYCADARYGDAARECELLLSEQPEWEPALRTAAVVNLKLGRLDESLQHHRKLIELGLADAEVHYNFAVLSEQTGDGADAAGHYAKAFELRPGFAEAMAGLGTALEKQGRTSEARRCWAQAMELKPALAKEYFRLR